MFVRGRRPQTSAGFEDCAEEPNTCNSGDRADGGQITWILDASPDGYFPFSPEGGSVYALQAIYGILPSFGESRLTGPTLGRAGRRPGRQAPATALDVTQQQPEICRT